MKILINLYQLLNLTLKNNLQIKYIKHKNYKLAYRVWYNNNDNPTLLFAHASGFHSMIWNQIIQKINNYNCIAIDFSGHGMSDNPDIEYKWDQFSNEIHSLIVELKLNKIIGIGHSLGAYAITHSTKDLYDRFESLILFDPSIFTKNKYAIKIKSRSEPHPISKRRDSWISTDEMYQRFSKRYPFIYWDNSVLIDYIEYGLTYNQSKEIYNLSSPPWAEARMMQGSAEYGIFDIINSFNKDVLILRANGKKSNENNDIFSKSVTDPDLHKLFSNSTDLLIDDVTHFIPQEKPQECARIINDHLNLLLKD